MPNRSTDALFQLIHSLQKAEKRNFKLYIKRNSGNDDLKIVQLFDALDKMTDYDEALLLKKNSTIKKQQLSNIKAHLYRELLASLRLLESEQNIDIQLHEQLDYARILYNKGLYLQSLKILDKIKETAKAHNQVSLLVQVIFLEKKIEALHITRSMQDRADQLTGEADKVNHRLLLITQLSNLSLQLYSWYIKSGHTRTEKEEAALTTYLQEHLPPDPNKVTGFYERLYLYQSYCWYAFIRQDFLLYYRNTQKWVDLFTAEPFMIEVETIHYIKGMHNLLNAHFDLQNYQKFDEALKQFEKFATSKFIQNNDNNRIQVFIYLYTAKLNKHFMDGTFKEGIKLIPELEEKLEEYSLYMDRHRVLIFYYKIASLYFGSGNYDKAIDYLNKIINWKVDLRNDLQCYARLLHLIAHYELGNFEILEYLVKSVYRFMAKMENLSLVEEEILNFLRKSFKLTKTKIRAEFEQLLEKLKTLERNRFETRAFIYLDVISWLESKLRNVPVQDIIREKYLAKMAGKENFSHEDTKAQRITKV
jgi:tetratricopeptide (TPR) repeat protein